MSADVVFYIVLIDKKHYILIFYYEIPKYC